MSSMRLALSLLVAGMLACSSATSPSTQDAAPPSETSTKNDAAAGCTAPTGATTWNNYGECFFKTYCVSCHNSSTEMSQNFNLYADVKNYATTVPSGCTSSKYCGIICGVSPMGEFQPDCPTSGFPPPGQFPIGSGAYPTSADRLLIVNWIKAGLPEN
jgi:hypothetical protein